jgi:hypothetical protein
MLELKPRCKVLETHLESEARFGGGSIGKASVACGTRAKPCEILATSLPLAGGLIFETASVKTRTGRRGVGCNGKYYCIESGTHCRCKAKYLAGLRRQAECLKQRDAREILTVGGKYIA